MLKYKLKVKLFVLDLRERGVFICCVLYQHLEMRNCVCVCVCVRERESVRVCVCVYVCAGASDHGHNVCKTA
jgi:hypothetical protein